MARLYLSEYANFATDENGHPIAAGREPALATQVVTVSGASAASAALNAKTKCVCLHCDGIFSYTVAAAPVATLDHKRVAANVDIFIGIDQGLHVAAAPLKIAAITNT